MKYEIVLAANGEPAIYKILDLGNNFKAAQHETKPELVLPLQTILERIPDGCRVMIVKPQEPHKAVSLAKRIISILLKE